LGTPPRQILPGEAPRHRRLVGQEGRQEVNSSRCAGLRSPCSSRASWRGRSIASTSRRAPSTNGPRPARRSPRWSSGGSRRAWCRRAPAPPRATRRPTGTRPRRRPAPFGSGKAATIVGDAARERVAALYLRKTFQVGDELERIKVLELRARYQDGLVARINDVEVARRAIDAGAPTPRLASRAHGPEWESFYVALRRGRLKPAENVLTLEVRPSAARLLPQVDVELTGREAERIVRGPIVGRVGTDRATIAFETDGLAVGEVRWGRRASSYDERLAGSP